MASGLRLFGFGIGVVRFSVVAMAVVVVMGVRAVSGWVAETFDERGGGVCNGTVSEPTIDGEAQSTEDKHSTMNISSSESKGASHRRTFILQMGVLHELVWKLPQKVTI